MDKLRVHTNNTEHTDKLVLHTNTTHTSIDG